MGYIAEEVHTDDLTSELKNHIILAIINNISPDPSIVKTTALAVKALFGALPYAS